MRLIVKQFEELSKKGLWTIIKQKGELNKIEITINDTVFYYSDLNKQSVDDILRKSEIDKSELNRIIALFNRINIVEVRNSGAGYIMVAIKEVVPYYLIYLNFCIAKNIDCINYDLPAHIETDVYFDRLSNP